MNYPDSGGRELTPKRLNTMQKVFEGIVSSFLENKIGIREHFFSKSPASHLKKNLEALHSKKQFQAAGKGNNTKLLTDQLIRSDVIYWLDRSHSNKHENSFFNLMDEFII